MSVGPRDLSLHKKIRKGIARTQSFFFAVLFLVLGLQGLWWFFQEELSARGSVHWPSTKGRVTSSAVYKLQAIEKLQAYRERFVDAPEFAYSYSDGKNGYVGRAIRYTPKYAPSRYTAELLAAYPALKEVTVYYDPRDPSHSCLEPGGKASAFAVATGLVGAFAFLIALFFLWAGLSGENVRVSIRPEKDDDLSAIDEVNDRAFSRKNEGALIRELRATPEFRPELSLVARRARRVVGHALLYPVSINDGRSKHPSLALGPMAVDPEFQRQGVGTRLVREGMKRASILGFNSIIVLGHAEYYPRFGFELAGRFGITVPFSVPDDAFMALELHVGAFAGVKGTVEYPKPYLDVC